MLIVPLVNISTLLPYNIAGRTAWLTMFLAGLIILLFCVYSKIIGDEFFHHSLGITQIMYSTLAALLVAVITTRKSLVKLFA